MFDRAALLAATAAHGAVARIVIADFAGSSPRETGAAMLVWLPRADGPPAALCQSGTIGGGALEWQASQAARARLAAQEDQPRLSRIALGPSLGQCCGGAVTLLCEVFTPASAALLPSDGLFARPVTADAATEPPLAIRRLLAEARRGGTAATARLIQGWMIEPLAQPARPLWLWGAGHVGRAIVDVMAPLPDFAITWIDTAPARFPALIPPGVTPLWHEQPQRLCAHAPQAAEHLILTCSHALDLELCHHVLSQGFHSLGVIGSLTKRARFRSRLLALGHDPAEIERLDCPIGEPELGKHPQAIAVGITAHLLRRERQLRGETRDDIRHRRVATARAADQGLPGRRREQ